MPGTDGLGLSDPREAARRHFGVEAPAIVTTALNGLARRGEGKSTAAKEVAERYGI